MTEKTINYIKLPDGETYKIGGSGSGFNLFDTKVSDHILEGEEALGWALQGTYVYKEGVAGSRTGYADFYNRCVEEYQEDNNTLSAINENITKVGVLTDDNGVLSGFSTGNYATLQNTFASSEIDECQIVFTTGNDITSMQGLFFASISDNSSSFGILNGGLYLSDKKYGSSKTLMSLGFSLSVNTKYHFKFTQSGTSITPYLSTDGIDYIQGTTVARSQNFGNMLGVGLSNDSPNTPYLGSIDLKECYINIGGSRWWTGADYVIQNPNGHKFYPISQKSYIDTIYESTGIADFYGIDTENERIFLPRNKYFAVTGGVKGNGNALGYQGVSGSRDLYSGVHMISSNATRWFSLASASKTDLPPKIGDELDWKATDTGHTSEIAIGINTDAAKSGITLESNENKYLYYCVGNTKVESAVSNVTEITTSENDTLPLFYNFYSKEDMTTTGAYVNASLGSYLSGNVYTTAYNELVKKLGTDNVKANTDTYTDYDFVVNQDDMTFRLPLKNGQEIMFATGVKGNGITLGLTNGTINTGLSAGAYVLSTSVSGYGNNVGSDASIGDIANNKSVGLTTDPTKSGIELDTENITIPDGWNLYYKLSNAVTNLELLDVAKVTADLNTCYKKNTTDNSILSSLSMPSNKSIDLELGASGTTYTAPANGWFSLLRIVSSADISIILTTNKKIYSRSVSTTTGTQTLKATLPVAKGDTLTVTWNGNSIGTYEFYFVYAEGEV